MFRLHFPIVLALLVIAAAAVPATAQIPVPQEETPLEQPTTDGHDPTGAPQSPEHVPDESDNATAEENVEANRDKPAAEADAGNSAAEPSVRKLTVSTWGGAYGQALENEILTPFGSNREVEIERHTHGDDAASNGDVVELSAAALEADCRSGALVKIDALALVVSDGTKSAQDDFIDGGVQPCGVGSFVWSAVIAVNEKASDAGKPASLRDVFDTKQFPGRRAFIKAPRYLLEMALIADGVPPQDVYQTLTSDEGVDRALTKLGSLGDDLTWHEGAKQAHERLAEGTAVFAQTFSGQAFFAAAFGAPISIIWDGHVYSTHFWAISADTAEQELAKEFVAYALAPQRLAAVAEETGYGPARSSAVPLTKQHPLVGLELKPYLPTQPENFARGLAFDEIWWKENEARVEPRFSAWLEAREPAPMIKPERKPE